MTDSAPSNKEIVHILRSVAAALTLTAPAQGASTFRTIAYQKAADAIEHLTQEVYDMWQNGHLGDIPGLGTSMQKHISEYFESPINSYLTQQLSKVPSPVYELMRAPGIGPKKAYKIVTAFGLENPHSVWEDVQRLADKNRIAELPTFGKKSQDDIVHAIETFHERGKREDRMTLPVATRLAEDVMAHMALCKGIQYMDALGSLRRRAPTIGDVDLIAVCEESDAPDVLAHFITYSGMRTVETHGKHEASIMVTGGRRVDMRVVTPSQRGSMLQYFTGNKAHNIKLREYALKKGLSLNEFGIKNASTGSRHSFSTEEEFYAFLDLPWIPPEIREGAEEIQRALSGNIPRLVELQDIHGEFHVHSSFDVIPSHDLGADTIETMAAMAASLGYTYLALSEHNPAQGKLKSGDCVDIVKRKAEALRAISSPVTLFNSLEIDIQPDGALALPSEAFDYLDMAIASIHSSFKMSKDDMTRRIIKAIQHPKVRILGHPTGRQIGKREEIEADWDEIFAQARAYNVALEINAWPERLDLPESLVRRALKQGNKLVINTDAHAADQMKGMRFGVYVARRGWATKDDIINTMDINDVTRWIHTET